MTRDRPTPKPAAIAVVLATLLGACGGVDVAQPPATRQGGPAEGGGSRVQGGGDAVLGQDWTVRRAGWRELVVSLTGAPAGDGPCDSRLRAIAEESATQVRLSVVDDNAEREPRKGESVACTAVGYQWSLVVGLDEDLGARRLVANDGRQLDISSALVPAQVPDGYTFTSESGGDGHHVLDYVSADGGWLMVATRDDDNLASTERMFTSAGERQADGRTFRLLENGRQKIVAFQLDGRSVWVSWLRQRTDSTAAISWDELVDVARLVR